MLSTISVSPFDLIFDQDLSYNVTKTFRLFSSVPLGDGLKQGIIVAKDGTTFRVIGESSLFPKKRKEVDVPFNNDLLDFETLGFLSAEVVDGVPTKVIEEMYS